MRKVGVYGISQVNRGIKSKKMCAYADRKDTVKNVNRWLKGFSTIEAITVLVILSVLAAIVVPTLSGVKESADRKSLEPTLALVAFEVRKNSPSVVPEYPATGVTVEGLAITSSASTGSDTVSVARVDDSTLLLTAESNGVCLILRHQYNGNEYWGESNLSCVAQDYVSSANQITGSLRTPTVIS